jgi:hypothetical protein
MGRRTAATSKPGFQNPRTVSEILRSNAATIVRSSPQKKKRPTANGTLHPRAPVVLQQQPICARSDGLAKFRFDTRCQTDPAAPGLAQHSPRCSVLFFPSFINPFFPLSIPALRFHNVTLRRTYPGLDCDGRTTLAEHCTEPFFFLLLLFCLFGLSRTRRFLIDGRIGSGHWGFYSIFLSPQDTPFFYPFLFCALGFGFGVPRLGLLDWKGFHCPWVTTGWYGLGRVLLQGTRKTGKLGRGGVIHNGATAMREKRGLVTIYGYRRLS